MTRTCSRAFSADSIAQGNDPIAPPCAAAITRSASMAPAIGACTIGNSVLKRSINRWSGHMVVSRLESESNLSGSSSSLEITPAGQDLLGLTGDPIDDFGRRRNIMDQSDSLAGDDCGNIKIPGGPRRGIVGRDGSDILHQLDLTAEPAPRVIIHEAASVKRRRPDVVAG